MLQHAAPHAAQARPRGETQACPAVPAVPSIREEAAALRAAQAAGTLQDCPSQEELGAYYARRRASASLSASLRWGLDFGDGEPVPVSGHDFEWSRVEAAPGGTRADTADASATLDAPASPAGHSQSRALANSRPGGAAIPLPPVKPKRRSEGGDEAPLSSSSCRAQTRQRRLLSGDHDASTPAPPLLTACWPR